MLKHHNKLLKEVSPVQFHSLKESSVTNKIVIHLLSKVRNLKLFCMIDDIFNTGEEIGYAPTKDAIYLSTGMPSATHEIGHMVEMNNYDRLIKNDWGLKLFTSKKLKASTYFAGAAREIRVRCIQGILEPGTEYLYSVGMHKVTNNPAWEQFLTTGLPFGRFSSLKDIQVWEADLAEKTTKAWSIDRIEAEWNKRIDYIHNWMETK